MSDVSFMISDKLIIAGQDQEYLDDLFEGKGTLTLCRGDRKVTLNAGMVATQYVSEKNRMCDSFKCGECDFPKAGLDCGKPSDPERAVRIVDEWSKVHPIVTNGDKLQEVFKDNFPYFISDDLHVCVDRRWFEQPYEAPKGAE